MDKLKITVFGKQYIKEFKHLILRCEHCGKFISQQSIIDQKSHFHFIPDSICGPEESYWECEKCKIP